MSAEEAALLRAIRDTPDDDLPRLALADWLDENDSPERAEFLRVQVELARLPHDSARRSELEDREHALLAENEEHWLGDLAAADGLHEWEFERGFLTEVAATPFCLSEYAPAVFAANPVRRWRVMSSDQDMSQDLLAAGRSNWIRRLDAIDLAGWFETIGELERFLTRSDIGALRELDLSGRYGLNDLPDILARSPFHAGLKVLRVGGRYGDDAPPLDATDLVRCLEPARLTEFSAVGTLMTGEDLQSLMASASFQGLTDLDVSENELDAGARDAFRTAKCRLRSLDMSGTPLGGILFETMLGLPALAELRVLHLERSAAGEDTVSVIPRSQLWKRLEVLRIGSIAGELHQLNGLLDAAGPTSLRTLDLSNNRLGDGGLMRLAGSPWAGGLTWLSVAQNHISDDGLKAFAAAGRLPHLRTLHLNFNNPEWLDESAEMSPESVGDAGLIALAGSSGFPNLRVIAVNGTAATHAAVDALLNAPHFALSGLSIQGCQVGPEVVRVLANSPRLARLNWLDLSHNSQLGDDVLMPLAESPYLCRLTELDLRGNYADDDVTAAFRQRLGRRLSL